MDLCQIINNGVENDDVIRLRKEIGFRRYTCIPQLQSLGFPTCDGAVNPNFALPEFDWNPNSKNKGIGNQFPRITVGGGSMELMAVPKRKVQSLLLF